MFLKFCKAAAEVRGIKASTRIFEMPATHTRNHTFFTYIRLITAC